jgi:hypothetical protein
VLKRLALRRRTLLERTPAWLSSLGTFLLVGWLNGRRMVFNADGDEGSALIQALLVRRGHPLYAETWSDQPPGYTWLLCAWSRVFGDAPEVVRLSTAFVLAAYAFACFELSRKTFKGLAGYLGGLACVAALLLQKEVFRYGAAAMVSLPAILFVGLGWAASTRAPSRLAACLAGALIACGMAIKPLGAPAIPGILLGTFVTTLMYTHSRRDALASVGMTLGSCVVVCALCFWPVFLREGGYTVYQTHRLASGRVWPGLDALGNFLRDDAWLVCGATLGVAVLAARRRVESLSLGLWLLFGALALALYEPVWTHHRYLILTPAVPLFGLGLGAVLEVALGSARLAPRAVAGCLIVASCAALLLLFPKDRLGEIQQAFGHKAGKENHVVKLIREGVPGARRMVTSSHMYAYRLGLDIPPSQAVTSRKRFQRWKLSADELVTVSLDFDPDVVALNERWPAAAVGRIRSKLAQSHIPIYDKSSEVVLARKAMISARLRKKIERSD